MGYKAEGEIDAIVSQVRDWPIGRRFQLVDRILETIDGTPRSKGNIAHLIGLFKTDAPPPTDEEIDQMRFEEMMRRYGS